MINTLADENLADYTLITSHWMVYGVIILLEGLQFIQNIIGMNKN
jgi:hypothetical protein